MKKRELIKQERAVAREQAEAGRIAAIARHKAAVRAAEKEKKTR